uniref:Bifunctional nuclease family protein n=1 Tax=candidate division WOR-3 bacterium TaxID=2052148 RepID=A0A7C4UBU0_UNCW3
MKEVFVSGFGQDEKGDIIIILSEKTPGKKVLPIWIGDYEAQAIARGLQKITPPRPLTHELLLSILSGLNYVIDKVVITDLKDNTFYAVIWLKKDNNIYHIDARPSDAIALSIMAGAPIYVNEDVLERGGINIESSEKNAQDIKKYLLSMKPEDFGKMELK